jgi:hypothetical protein
MVESRLDRLTNHPDWFEKLNFPSRFAPSTATTTPKNEIGKPGLFYLVYCVGFNSQGESGPKRLHRDVGFVLPQL